MGESLEAAQDRLDLALSDLMARVMTVDEFEALLENSLFGLDWDVFYDQLDQRLRAEAYSRYEQWAEPKLPADLKSLPAPSTTLKRKDAPANLERLKRITKKRVKADKVE